MTAFPKREPSRSEALRRMARKHGCQMRWAAGCRGDDTSTTVLAHQNSLSAGKGMARKADDHLGVYACYACHAALDQGRADAQEKAAAMDVAMARQAALYEEIAASVTARPADREAARWALSRMRP